MEKIYVTLFLFLAEDIFDQITQFHQLPCAVYKGETVVIGSTGLGNFYQSAEDSKSGPM